MSGLSVPELRVSRLVIWRHGRTEWNASGRFQGQLDPPLDASGREQAAATAPHLIAAGLAAESTVVVSSDLSRAAQTAVVLTGLLGVPLRLDARLREHQLGSWQGLTRADVAARFPDQYANWLAGRSVEGRGGEQPHEVRARALAALADLPEVHTAVVVTHGGTSARLIEALLDLGPERRRLFGPLGNCSWSELQQHGGHWRLMRHNAFVPKVGEAPTGGNGTGATERSGSAASGTTAEPMATDADAVL